MARGMVDQLLAFTSRFARILRTIIGVPDYERYVDHCRAHHPGGVPMTREQFAIDVLERKYTRPGTRCC